MPDNNIQLPPQQTPIQPFIQPYDPVNQQLNQKFSELLKLYQPSVNPVNPVGVTNPADLPQALKNALNNKDPYFNSASIDPITTAFPIAERHVNGPAGYSIYQDNEDANAKAQDEDGFLIKQLRGDYGPLSLGWYGGLAGKAIGKFVDGFGSLYELAKYGLHGAAEQSGLAEDDKINSFGE